MIGIEGIPMIKEGDDLTSIILDASQECGVELLEGDIFLYCPENYLEIRRHAKRSREHSSFQRSN